MPKLSGIVNTMPLTITYTLPLVGAILLLLAVLYYYITQNRQRQLRTMQERTTHQQQQLLQLQAKYFKLLAEKEWLVREVHHRVKNNLQLVISLLNMQTGYLKDEFSRDAFGDIGSRIRAISLIHQRMYQEENKMMVINMRDYVTELVGCLEHSLHKMGDVHFRLEIAPIDLAVSQSVPVGLILNEAITNSVKYAFSAQATPTILISMRQQDNDLISLTIADNGKGLPENFSLEKNAFMGLRLIKTLSDQLDGDLRIQNDDGVLLTLQFTRQAEGY